MPNTLWPTKQPAIPTPPPFPTHANCLISFFAFPLRSLRPNLSIALLLTRAYLAKTQKRSREDPSKGEKGGLTTTVVEKGATSDRHRIP